MSCINLPTVLPGSPSKTRGQIQVPARGRDPSTREGGRGPGRGCGCGRGRGRASVRSGPRSDLAFSPR